MNEDTTEERQHHPFSPSKLQFLEACPCYESRDSKHARSIAGTLAHKVTETGEDSAELSDEDAEAAAECMDFWSARKQEMEKSGPVLELIEAYLPIDDCEFENGIKATTAGYVDRVAVSHDKKYAEVADWKFGVWPVEKAENNLQAIAYCLGLFKRYPSLESIRFFFRQPLIKFNTDHTFSRLDVPHLYLRVQAVVARAQEARKTGNFSTANPVIPACNFCANIGRCPAVAAIALRVGKKFHPLEIPEQISPTAVLNPADAGIGMRLSQVVETWAGAFRRQTSERVFRGATPCPAGYTIESRSGNREITDIEKFKFHALRHVSKEKFDAALSVTLGPIEKAISDAAPRGVKKEAVQAFKKEIEDAGIVERAEGYAFLRAVAEKE